MTADQPAPESVLVSPVRRRIVAELSLPREPDEPGQGAERAFADRRSLTVKELADLLDLHVSTLRFHLDQLVAAGFLECANERRGVGRPRLVYALNGAGLPTATRGSRALTLLAELLVTELAARDAGQGTSPQQLGEEWARNNVLPRVLGPAESPGDWAIRTVAVREVMAGWGFGSTATTDTDGVTTLALTGCPFRELAQLNQHLVCGIHRGIMTGTLRQQGAPDARVELQPAPRSPSCAARIIPGTPTDSSTAPADISTAPQNKESTR